MTAGTLATQVAEMFNRHGKFTARTVAPYNAVEIRYLDTGLTATMLWLPDGLADWMWRPQHEFSLAVPPRSLNRAAGVADVVRAVATSLLDERPKP